MSVRVMALVWDSTVPAPERFTLLALADRADEDGKCWPSIPTLAQKCCTSESTIRRHLKGLEKAGVVSVQRRFNNSSLYTISIKRLRSLAHDGQTPSQNDRGSQSDTPPQSDRGSQSAGGCQSAQTPPVNLTGPPSQSERLSTKDPSVDPPGTTGARAPRSAPGAQLAIVQPAEVAVANLNQGHLVAAWAEGFAETHDAAPTTRQRGQVARECGELLRAGNPPDRVMIAARSAGRRGFATVEREYADLSSRRGAPGARSRQSTTDARVQAAVDLASQYPEESA